MLYREYGVDFRCLELIWISWFEIHKMKYVTVEYYKLDKKCQFIVVLIKKSIYHVTKGVKRLFFQLLVSFNFRKSILDDVILYIEMIFKFGLKTLFLDTF